MVMVYEGSALKHLARTRLTGAEPAGEARSRPRSRRAEPQDRSRSSRNGDSAPNERSARKGNAGQGGGSAKEDQRIGDSTRPGGAHDHAAPSGSAVTCGFCGRAFVEDRSQATCQACPLNKACGLMRCPHCGYENAKEPGWLTKIKEWIG